jgi:hypothetical protein
MATHAHGTKGCEAGAEKSWPLCVITSRLAGLDLVAAFRRMRKRRTEIEALIVVIDQTGG